MNRFLSCTAVGLLLGLTPALAETKPPADAMTPPAVNRPSQVPEVMPADPVQPSDSAVPIPSGASQTSPEPTRPGQAEPGPEPRAQSSEAPKSLAPGQQTQQSAAASPTASPFIVKEGANDLLVGNLIGATVLDTRNNSIGEVSDLVTDQNGKLTAVVIGAGGFLGIGEKDVAIRYEDVKIVRDQDDNATLIANISKEALTSAPDYQTLDEQQITLGERGDHVNKAE